VTEPGPAENDAVAILTDSEEGSELAILADAATESEEFDLRPWRCPNCREVVEHNFDICWKCGTDREGIKDLEFVVDNEEREPEEDEAQIAEAKPVIRSCVRCGSQRVVPDAPICDQGQHSDGRLYTIVVGNPDAVLFQDRMFGEIRADICGDCGHVELHARHAASLYEHYLQSLKNRA
jgi:hypothetical protein